MKFLTSQAIIILILFAAQSACQNNSGCSQLCVLKPGGRRCLCETGMKLAEDGTTCMFCNIVYEGLNTSRSKDFREGGGGGIFGGVYYWKEFCVSKQLKITLYTCTTAPNS